MRGIFAAANIPIKSVFRLGTSAFVEFPHAEALRRALACSGALPDGRVLKIAVAAPRPAGGYQRFEGSAAAVPKPGKKPPAQPKPTNKASPRARAAATHQAQGKPTKSAADIAVEEAEKQAKRDLEAFERDQRRI